MCSYISIKDLKIKFRNLNNESLNQLVHGLIQDVKKSCSINFYGTKMKILQSERQDLIHHYQNNHNNIYVLNFLIKIIEQNQINENKQAFRLLGGGGCGTGSKVLPYSNEERSNLQSKQKQKVNQSLQKMKTITIKSYQLDKDFLKNYEKYINDQDNKNQTIQNEDQIPQMHRIFQKCISNNKLFISSKVEAYRNHVFEIFDVFLQYMISGASNDGALTDDITELSNQITQFSNHIQQKVNSQQCQDLLFMTQFLLNLNSQRVGLDERNKSQLEKVARLATVIIKLGISIGTAFTGIGSFANALQSLVIDGSNIITQIIDIASTAYSSFESVNSVIANSNTASKAIKKDQALKYLAGLWARKIDYFGQKKTNITIEEEIEFYIDRFIELTQAKSSNDLILYVMTQINYLLDKGGLGNPFDKEKENRFALSLAKSLDYNNPKIKEFVDMLQQKSNQLNDNSFQFFRFSIQDPTYRFLSNQILLKYNIVINLTQDLSEEQKELYWLHLCYQYVTEKKESVKIVFLNNQDFVKFVNQKISEKPSETAQLIMEKQKEKKEEFKKNNITDKEISEVEVQIKDIQDFLDKIALNLVQKWELEAKQRMDSDLTFKDDILLEVQDLYINQNISYLSGNQIFSHLKNDGQQQPTNKNAIEEIIQNFLKPNNQQQNNTKKQCKILGILAEGGTGKSMLIKKLETIILKEKNTKELEELNYIPFIIRCNSLDPINPSIDGYLKSQNLDDIQIKSIKQSSRNKLILLDGYDEFSGEYFRVYQKLQLNEWTNVFVIVTSRKEKLTETDAQAYFSLDDEKGKRDDNSYSIVKLEEFKRKDIDEYCQKYFRKQRTSQDNQLNQVQFDKDISIMQQCLNNKQLELLLFLPINLYLFTRMIATKEEQELKVMIQNVSDQIQIQEMFFQEQFIREAKDFSQLIEYKGNQQNLNQKVSSAYFEYFQTVAMQMFLNKGMQANFLQVDKSQICFQLQESLKSLISKSEQLKLEDKILNYVNSKIITKLKDEKSELSRQQNEYSNSVEFRHKSLFEYFVARAMKFDFDTHQENIHKLDLNKLAQFNINKKSIMNPGQNQSEQQILIKLFKLIKRDIDSAEFINTFNKDSIDKTNRYIQYLKKSKISKNTEVSQIDTGASNLLSALFMSKFAFPNLNLSNCSFSKAYIPYAKSIDINLQYTNLNQAFLKGSNLNFDTSNTSNAYFNAFLKKFDIENIYSMSDVKFDNSSNLYTVNRFGYLNYFNVSKNQHKLIKSKQITSSKLNSIFVQNKYLIITSDHTIFLINEASLETSLTHMFNDKIVSISITKNNGIYITLEDNSIHFANFSLNFNKLEQTGLFASASPNGQFLALISKDSLKILNISQKYSLVKDINQPNLKQCKFSEDSKFLATYENYFCFMYSSDKNFELVKKIEGHQDNLKGMDFSKDGKYIATISADRSCRIWSMSNNFERVKVINEYENATLIIAFSNDSKNLAVTQQGDQCKIWDVSDNFSKKCEIFSHKKCMSSISYSSDGKYLATGSLDKTCKIWDIHQNYQLKFVIEGHKDEINQIAFSNNNKYLATCSYDKSVKIWDVQNNFTLIKTIEDFEQQVQCLVFSHDSKKLATGSNNSVCYIWNVENNFELIKPITGHEDSIFSVVFSTDGTLLITSSSDKTIRVWDVEKDYSFIQLIEGHSDFVKSMSLSSNGKYLATGSYDKTCKIWNVQKKFELILSLDQFEMNVPAVAFSDDCRYLATGCDSTDCYLWDVEKGFDLVNKFAAHDLYITSVAFSKDNQSLATCSFDITFKIWNTNGFELIQTNDRSSEEFYSATFTKDCKHLITGHGEKSLMVWNTEKGFELCKTIKAHNNAISSLSLSNDGKYLATCSFDMTCKIWDIHEDYNLIHTIKDVHTAYIRSVAFSPCGKYLATGSYDKTCKILNFTKNFELVKSLESKESLVEIAFSKDGKYFATSSFDKTCSLWNAESNNFELIHTFTNHKGAVCSIAFSSDSSYFVTGSYDKSFCVWNLKQNFELVKSVNDNKSQIYSLAFSPDGLYLASHSENQCLIWSSQNNFELAAKIKEHKYSIDYITFSGDGKYLLTFTRQSCRISQIQQQDLHHNENKKQFITMYIL